jgi:hypothetical protein
VAARFGRAIDHLLLYGKAGGGWVGNNNLTVTNLTTGASFTCGTLALTNCGNNAGGWLVSGGFEYAFTNNWTLKYSNTTIWAWATGLSPFRPRPAIEFRDAALWFAKQGYVVVAPVRPGYGATAIEIPERGLFGLFFSGVGNCSDTNFRDAGLAPSTCG